LNPYCQCCCGIVLEPGVWKCHWCKKPYPPGQIPIADWKDSKEYKKIVEDFIDSLDTRKYHSASEEPQRCHPSQSQTVPSTSQERLPLKDQLP